MSPSRPPDVRVAEVVLEPDESNAATLAHLRQHAAVLPVALEGIVDMWQPHGWAGQLDGRPVLGSLDGFDDAKDGQVGQSASISRHGDLTLEVIVLCMFRPDRVTVTAQAVTQEHADRVAEAARLAWCDPPPAPARRTRIERAGRQDARRRTVLTWTRRKAAPFVSGLVVGAFLGALGVTGALEDAAGAVLDWLAGLRR